uniref:Uncharacterized protein n=1 Tax=Glossina pallidipes TaxID=7398 RepID=A0A1A9Z2V4_GLOPL
MPLNVIYIKFEYQLVTAADLGGLKLFKIIPQSKSVNLLSDVSRLCNSDLTKKKNPNQFKEHGGMIKSSLRPNIDEHYWKIDRCYKQDLRNRTLISVVTCTVGISLNVCLLQLEYQLFVINRARELLCTTIITARKCFLRAISDIKVAFVSVIVFVAIVVLRCVVLCCVVVIAAVINHTLCISVIRSTAYSGMCTYKMHFKCKSYPLVCGQVAAVSLIVILITMESALMCDNSISISEEFILIAR